MSHPKSDSRSNFIRAILFILVGIGAATLIIYLKQASDIPLTPEGIAHRDSIQRMATPDTMGTPGIEENDTYEVPASETDTVSTDLRVPSDAGYEDGYYAGLDDGINDDPKGSYDPSSQFPTQGQRNSYADAYKRGYTAGYQDGQNGEVQPEDTDPKAPESTPPNNEVEQNNSNKNQPGKSNRDQPKNSSENHKSTSTSTKQE